MRLLEKSPYLDVTLIRNERKLNPQSITQTKITEGYTLSISLTEHAHQEITLNQAGSFALFFDAVVEAASSHDATKILSSETQLTIHFSNNQMEIEQVIKELRHFELDNYCLRNNIKITSVDFISQGISLELGGLILLVNALIQNTVIALSNHLILTNTEKAFGPSMTRF
ncbi:MAG: hypothetical protein Q8L78_06280 [Coxiellaceae bacterium]|nr:hypothetical protein [Coxiellaceae bacterium]